MQHYLGYLLIFLAATLWGLTGPVARFVLADGMSPIEVGFWRAALGGLFFAVHAVGSGQWKLRQKEDGLVFCLFGAVGVGGFFVCYQFAVHTGGAALAAVLLATAPAWVAILSRWFFSEGLTPAKLAAIALSLAGVACLSFAGEVPKEVLPALPQPVGSSAAGGFWGIPTSALGVVFGLCSGFMYSTHYIFSKKYLERYTSMALYGYCMLFGALVLLPVVPFAQKTPTQWGILMVLGFVCTYGAYLAYCAGIKRLTPTRAVILASFEPVIATLFAVWLWNESFLPLGWVGSLLILGAVMLTVLEKKNVTAV